MNSDVISSLISIRSDLLRDGLVYWNQHGGFLHVVLEDLPLSCSQGNSPDTVTARSGVGGGGDTRETVVSLDDGPESGRDLEDEFSTLKGKISCNINLGLLLLISLKKPA